MEVRFARSRFSIVEIQGVGGMGGSPSIYIFILWLMQKHVLMV